MSGKKTDGVLGSMSIEDKPQLSNEEKMEAGNIEVLKVVDGVAGADKLGDLIERGKKKGNLSASELMDVLENMDLESDQMDKIYDTLENLGIDTVGDDYLPELADPARLFLAQQHEPHLALGWALAARAWGISPQDALAAWLWSWLENQLAVLMKTLPLGQQAAQRMTSELSPTLQQAQQHASSLDLSHLGSAAFGLSLASMAHERQYSRLFRS